METVCDRLGDKATTNHWVAAQRTLRHGVFVSNPRFNKKHHLILSKILRVADKRGPTSLLMHAAFDRRGYMRQGIIASSRENICRYVAALINAPTLAPGTGQNKFDCTEQGVYWDIWHPQHTPDNHAIHIHPYIDIDVSGAPPQATFHDVFHFVHTAIVRINNLFSSMSSKSSFDVKRDLTIFYNRRQQKDGYKFSFHIHWHCLVIHSTTSLASILRPIADQCPAPHFNFDNFDNLTISPHTDVSILDMKVYGSNSQLFRMPYTGKRGDATCHLLPIHVERSCDGLCLWQAEVQTGNHREWLDRSCTFTLFPQDFTTINIPESDVHALTTRQPLPMNGMSTVQSETMEQRQDRKSWLRFMAPVIDRFVLPNFVKHRQALMSDWGVDVASPDPDSIHYDHPIARVNAYPASFRINVHGDNFCEYDEGVTPHRHRGESNAISYIIDLNGGRIAQQCQKCRPRSLNWASFFQVGLLAFEMKVGAQARRLCHDVVSCGKSEDAAPFFLKYFQDHILFCRSLKKVMAFNTQTGVWESGSNGNKLLIEMVNSMNQDYKAYRQAKCSVIAQTMIDQWLRLNPDADEDAMRDNENKENGKCRKEVGKIPNLFNLSMAQKTTLWTLLRTAPHPHQREVMEPHQHLVPLLDRKCIDVYTWKLLEIRPDHYFTSRLNGSIIHFSDPTVLEFIDWQKKVCCGNDDYLLYKFRIMGLTLTLMNFDRAFYMPHGSLGRNGKSSESALFNLVTMSSEPHRGMSLAREYLSKSSQDRKGANAPDTVLMNTSHKCAVIADECRDTVLDGTLIKSWVSGDSQSARNLYESETTSIDPQFTLWVIANKVLKLDYGDSALMNRLRVMPYRCLWQKKSMMSETIQKRPLNLKMWVFEEDPYFKDKAFKDGPSSFASAMVTKCLYELHLFLKQLPHNPTDPTRPAKLESFPVPAVVHDYTQEVIQREHPVLGFISMHLGKTDNSSLFHCFDDTFKNFQLYGHNANTYKMKNMTKPQFEEALSKEHISLTAPGADGTPPRLDGYCLKLAVPNHDRQRDNDSYAMIPFVDNHGKSPATVNNNNYDYVPPAIKRIRYE